MQYCQWCGGSFENYDHEAQCTLNPAVPPVEADVKDWLHQANQQSPQGQALNHALITSGRVLYAATSISGTGMNLRLSTSTNTLDLQAISGFVTAPVIYMKSSGLFQVADEGEKEEPITVPPPPPKPAPKPCPTCGGLWSHKFACPELNKRVKGMSQEQEVIKPRETTADDWEESQIKPKFCPYCSGDLMKNGRVPEQVKVEGKRGRKKYVLRQRQRYRCKACGRSMSLAPGGRPVKGKADLPKDG